MLRAPLTAALALSFGLGFGPVSAQPVEVDTASGPITLQSTPTSVVALDVAAIDSLTALGVMPAGIVRPVYVDYLPAGLDAATGVGSFFEPDMEAIAALRPDLIVVGARAAAMAGPLSAIAPVADMSVGTDALADGKARLAAYGRMFGKDAEANEMLSALEARIADMRARVEADGGDALILMTNGPKLSVFGPQSRFGWLHTALGFPEAVEGITENRHGEAVSFEYVAEADPDTIFVIDRGAAIADGSQAAMATLDTPLIQGTRAAQAGRIVYLSPRELYIASGGIQSLNRTLDEIDAAFGAM